MLLLYLFLFSVVFLLFLCTGLMLLVLRAGAAEVAAVQLLRLSRAAAVQLLGLKVGSVRVCVCVCACVCVCGCTWVCVCILWGVQLLGLSCQ